MDRTASQAARVLGVEVQQVKKWAWQFKEYLSSQANPPKGRSRAFSDSDLLVLMHVAMYWEEDPDIESIRAGLDCEDHYTNDRLREILYLHTPLLQEPPNDLDETWRHGILLNGGGVQEYLELARSYKQSADALLDSALASGESRDWGFPVLFAYRHALELYLKIIGNVQIATHSLKKCVFAIERRYGQRIGSPIRDWIIELDQIDPQGAAFRYADDRAADTLKYAEYWVDFVHFKYAMSRVFKTLDQACLTALRQKFPG